MQFGTTCRICRDFSKGNYGCYYRILVCQIAPPISDLIPPTVKNAKPPKLFCPDTPLYRKYLQSQIPRIAPILCFYIRGNITFLVIAIFDLHVLSDRDPIVAVHSIFPKNFSLTIVVVGSRHCRDIIAASESAGFAGVPSVATF
jgi:hypothetical protein